MGSNRGSFHLLMPWNGMMDHRSGPRRHREDRCMMRTPIPPGRGAAPTRNAMMTAAGNESGSSNNDAPWCNNRGATRGGRTCWSCRNSGRRCTGRVSRVYRPRLVPGRDIVLEEMHYQHNCNSREEYVTMLQQERTKLLILLAELLEFNDWLK